MRDFFLGPALSLASLKFYRRLLVQPVTLGFLYLAYLSLLFSLWVLVVFRLQVLPVADEFAVWLGENLPEMTLTREGLQMKIANPLLLSHPRFGPLIYLDPAKDSPDPNDFKEAWLVLTRKNLGYHNPTTGEYRIQSLIPKRPQKKWRDLALNGERIARLWRRVRPFLAAAFFVFSFSGVYLWKLAAGLAYSLVGLILNRFRREKLPYSSLLNLTFFALTPVAWLQLVVPNVPGLRLPIHFLTSLPVTTLYLSLAILGTQEKPLKIEN